MKFPTYFKNIFGAAVVSAASIFSSTLNAQFFKDSDRVCFIGDSITNAGEYMAHIQLYYATRFPQNKVSFFNCGISGDKTGGVYSRIDNIFRYNPTIATVMLGMNDVENTLYNPVNNITQATLEKRIEVNKRYYELMPKLIDSLLAKNVRVVSITPSIYDETAQIERKPWLGRQESLLQYSEFLRKLAADKGLQLVDFNAFMLELNAKEQKKDPTFTVVGEDRVHPRGRSAFFMSYKFLKDVKETALVSDIRIDAANKELVKSSNATVYQIRKDENALEFDVKANALPMPVLEMASDAAKYVNFYQDLNNENLSITNLSGKNFELFIDGISVGKYKAEELSTGVNLAENTSTPQYKDALEIGELILEYRVEFKIFVSKVEAFEHFNLKANTYAKPLSEAEYMQKAADLLAKSKDNKKIAAVKEYMRLKPQTQKIISDLQVTQSKIHELCLKAASKTRHYKLVKLD